MVAKAGRVFLFLNESRNEGDRVGHQVSDTVLDAYLASDPKFKVACEMSQTSVKNNMFMAAEEVIAASRINHETVV